MVMPSTMPLFLENVEATEDGYLWVKSQPKHQDHPPILPHSEKLWNQLHSPLEVEYPSQTHSAEPFELAELHRTRGLMEAIRLSLAEIEQMKEDKNDKSMRLSVNRLKKQQTARLNQASPEALHIVEEQAYLDATVKTIKTLNAIRAIFPLLIRMFHHDDTRNQTLELSTRNDQGQVIGTLNLEKISENTANNKKKESVKRTHNLVWLLGDYVYDTCRAGQFRTLNESLWRILKCILPDERQISQLTDMKEVGESFWIRLLPDFVQDHNVRRQVPSPNTLFASLPLETQIQAHAIAKACDEKYLTVFHHENEDTQETRLLYQAAVDKLINNLRMVIQQRYHGSEVRVYGSCLSNLALGKSSDVDLSLHLPAFAKSKHLFETGQIEAKQYEKDTRTYVYRLRDILARKSPNGFRITECITRARVPVIKGKYVYANNPYSLDGSLEFDICFSNEIAVVNSALLSEYTLINERVKTFLLSIKAWAKLYKISSAADARISSYAWVNLGIFYLQCISFVPNLQSPEFMAQHEFERDPENWSHCANDLNTCFMPWDIVVAKNEWTQPDELKDAPVTLLMYGFLHFYAKHFPKTMFAVSIREGSIKLPKATFGNVRVQNLSVEDPFETHCSHAPHDLGKPAGEAGHVVIAKALADSEAFLRGVLIGDVIEDTKSHFWTLTQVAERPKESLGTTLYASPPEKEVSSRNRGKGQQHTARGRSGQKGNRAGNGGDDESRPNDQVEEEKPAMSGDHHERKHYGKRRANNKYQKKAAMQPPMMNGVKNLHPNNAFQRKPTRNAVKEGGGSGPRRRRSKNQTPDKGSHDVALSPAEEKDDDLGPSRAKNSRRKKDSNERQPGRCGGERPGRNRGKKNGAGDGLKDAGFISNQEDKVNRLPLADEVG